MRTKLAHLLILASLVGVAFSAMVPVADAGCSINAGYCGKGCNYKVNAGSCGHGCEGLLNVGSCSQHPPCDGGLLGGCQILPRSRAHDDNCAHPGFHSHTYAMGVTVGVQSDTAFGGGETGVGVVIAIEGNVADCNGDGVPGDFDGDYEDGIGGGFFGFGPWADEATCGYDLETHGASVVVNDVLWGSQIAFVIGADDTSGPAINVDPVTGETTCSVDGTISPGDPSVDPTADADDCFTDVLVGSGTTCGHGGDGGYWVFLNGAFVSEGAGGLGASNPPTLGVIAA